MSRSPNKSQQKYIVALRQLALCAPGGDSSLIAGGRLLQNIVPSDNTCFLWLNKNCDTINAHTFEDMPFYVFQDYMENFMHTTGPNSEESAGFTMKQVHTSNRRVMWASQKRDHKQFMRSSFYDRFIKHVHAFWLASLPLRQVNGMPLAVLSIGRSPRETDFNPIELQLLEQAQPWLEHLAVKDSMVVADNSLCISSGGQSASASLLMDAAGKVLSASAFALTLLHQAADTPLANSPLRQTAQGDVNFLLRRMSSSVANAMNALAALPPSRVINNRWGRFHLHAYVLNHFESGTPMQISLHIEHQIPLSLGLFRLTRFLELTPREREVCLHTLAGLDYKEIATEFGVKPSTFIYFTRQLYRRLNIYKQSELLPALML